MGISCGYASGMNTNHISHQMYAVSNTSYYAHITKEVTQATIDTTVIDTDKPVQTLCNKTFTWGSAWEIADNTNHAMKVCKACAAKAGK
jgi:hypothetical protein